MRKTKLFKRSAAVVISASMVLTSVNVIPELKEEAKAANATTPFASFDFTNSNLKEANGNGEVTGIENGEATADGLKLTNGHAALPSTLFNNYSGDGLTVQMKYQKHTSEWPDNQWSEPLFNFSAPLGDGETATSKSIYCSYNGNIGTGKNLYGGDGAWLDGSFGLDLGKDTWHTVTVTYDVDTNTVTDYIDGVKKKSATSDKASLSANDIKNFTNNAIGYHTDGGWSMWSFCTIANMSLYDTALSEAQVMTAYLGFDATKISDAINKASDIRSECYTKETADAFNEKLEAAKKAASTAGAKQADVDAAADALTDAQAKLVRKSENLTSDVLVNTDFTDKTSTVDKTAKTVTNDGYTLKAVGDSDIQDGYINGANDVYTYNGKNGVILDGSVLRNTTSEKGFTINAKLSLNAKSLDANQVADWSDVIGLYDDDFESTDATTGETNKETIYKLRGTLGLAMMSPTGIFEWPGAVANTAKVKDASGTEKTISGVGGVLSNGYAWNSYQTEGLNEKTINYTITLNKDAYSIYINGKLAATYANNDDNWLDVDSIINSTDSIRFMQTTDSTVKKDSDGKEMKDADGNDVMARLDLLGKLYGVQVYGRALNAAEVDTLISKGIDVSLNTITFKNQAADATISVKDANGTEVATAVCGTDGSAVVHGLTTGQTYTFTIKNGETWTREGSIAVDADKVIDGWVATGVKFKEETLELKNSKIKATGEVKNDVKNLPALVLDPENTSEKIEDCKVSYASDKEEVAKVSEDGKVTAVADGEANITATVVTPSGNTLTAVCKVKVSTTEVTDVATAVKLDQETASIEIGKTLQLKAEVTPGTALQQGTWKSSNEAVAKVNEAGLVTAVAAGEAEITFTTVDGTNLSAKCKVTVTAKAEPTAKPSATPAPGTSAKPAPGTSTEPTAKPSAKPTAKPTVAPTKKPSNTKKPAKKLKSATITVKNGKKKVSSVTVKRKKSVKLAVSVNSKAKLSVAKLSKKNAKVAKVTFKKNKLTIKGLKKGKVSIKITSKKTSKYKAATKTIKVTVKK